MKRSDISIFTVCSICYLPKALVLAESVYKIDGIKIDIFIVDKKNECVKDYQFANIRWIEDEKVPNINKLAFIYDVTEFSTCIKPMLALRLLEKARGVVFLDPDICVYSTLTSIYEALDLSPILLTPHYLTPKNKREDNYDLAMMRFGSFNLGFFAVSSSEEAKQFLGWWSERCINLGFFETQFGLSVDQKWVSIAPCFFPGLKILFDPGLNMAFWNLHEREITEINNTYIVNNKNRLVFFHFSSFDEKKPNIISKRPHEWSKTGRQDLRHICEDYACDLHRFDENYSSVKYGFDYMDNGMYISPTLRRAYAAVADDFNISNPFVAENKMERFISINHLNSKRDGQYKAEGVSDIPKYARRFRIINSMMRIALRYLGPNSFYNLSRLFVYLSSYRQNHNLWRLPE
jgi:hypothetical protein